MLNPPMSFSTIKTNKPEYNYKFCTLHCATCNKVVGNIGFYFDRRIDITAREVFNDLMIDNGIHYEIRCDKCMSPAEARGQQPLSKFFEKESFHCICEYENYEMGIVSPDHTHIPCYACRKIGELIEQLRDEGYLKNYAELNR